MSEVIFKESSFYIYIESEIPSRQKELQEGKSFEKMFNSTFRGDSRGLERWISEENSQIILQEINTGL